MSKRKRKQRRMGRWALGIGCMLLSAGAFAAVIYFSHAGRDETDGTDGTQQVKEDQKEKDIQKKEENKRQIDKKLGELSIEEKVAQMFIITPDALTGVEGTWNPGKVTETAYHETPVGGLIMMGNNLISQEQVQTWNMSEIGATDDSKKAYEAGKTIGTYLKELGFNLDFAPMADVRLNSENITAQHRSFGSDPKLVSDMVSESVEGFHSQGIYTVAKHFPGDGGTEGESHEKSVPLNRTKEELKESELLPFEAAIGAGTGFVMVGHISLPEILTDDTPASLSEDVVTEMLREELGYEGIIITDSMDMGAITDHYTSGEAAVKAVQAGVDMILMPQNFEEAYQGILEAVHQGTISEERIDASIKRILEVKMNETSNLKTGDSSERETADRTTNYTGEQGADRP